MADRNAFWTNIDQLEFSSRSRAMHLKFRVPKAKNGPTTAAHHENTCPSISQEAYRVEGKGRDGKASARALRVPTFFLGSSQQSSAFSAGQQHLTTLPTPPRPAPARAQEGIQSSGGRRILPKPRSKGAAASPPDLAAISQPRLRPKRSKWGRYQID